MTQKQKNLSKILINLPWRSKRVCTKVKVIVDRFRPNANLTYSLRGCHRGNAIQHRGSSSPKFFLGSG